MSSYSISNKPGLSGSHDPAETGYSPSPVDYLPVEYLFNLLSVLRRGEVENVRALRSAVQGRKLWSLDGAAPHVRDRLLRISFWTRLAQSAGLLDEATLPQPTLLVPEWLETPLLGQVHLLLDAWLHAPAEKRTRQARKRAVQKLFQERHLPPGSGNDIAGLTALGLIHGGALTALGIALAENFPIQDDEAGRQNAGWELSGSRLIIVYPPNWRFLWELERYLEPESVGVYRLDEDAFRQAVQRGALENRPSLAELLTQGLGESLPDEIATRLNAAPQIRIFPGPVLEFNSQMELSELRKSPSMRQWLRNMISPRYVRLERGEAGHILKTLQRRGYLTRAQIETFDPKPENESHKIWLADRAYLLSLHRLAMQVGLGPAPEGIEARLVEHLPAKLIRAAHRRAREYWNTLGLAEKPPPEYELPAAPPQGLIAQIEEAIRLEKSLDVQYRRADQTAPEARRISPLLLEQRGGRNYLIAYCHTRRANRTFRLDRMQIKPQPPAKTP